MSASDEFSLHGKRMCVTGGSANGVVDRHTVIAFVETGGIVTGSYAGGRVSAGVLAGVRKGSLLSFRYAQVDDTGRIDGGRSVCDLAVLSDGRLRLVEHFTWESRPGSGSNVFEELPGLSGG